MLMCRAPGSFGSRRIIVAMVAALLATVMAATAAWPAMAEPTLQQLAGKADQIVEGTVLTTESWWDSTHSYIFTTAILRTSEVIKGTTAVDSTVSILVPGGEVGGVGFGVEHAPHFAKGETAIVFLTVLGDGRFRVTGWEQGKFTIHNNQVVENGISVLQFKDQIRKSVK